MSDHDAECGKLTGRPLPGPLLIGGWLTLVAMAFLYFLTALVISRISPLSRLMPFVESVYSSALIGTTWYGVGRFFVALPSWRPDVPRARFRAAIVHFAFNFLVIFIAIVPAGSLMGVAAMNGASRDFWQWPVLACSLVIAHLAWTWADSRADRTVQRFFPSVMANADDNP